MIFQGISCDFLFVCSKASSGACVKKEAAFLALELSACSLWTAVFVCLLCFIFRESISLCPSCLRTSSYRSDWLQTHRHPPASAPRVLGLKVSTTTAYLQLSLFYRCISGDSKGPMSWSAGTHFFSLNLLGTNISKLGQTLVRTIHSSIHVFTESINRFV